MLGIIGCCISMSGWGDLFANQVISWYTGSTNYYWRLFDSGLNTNTIYVSQAIEYFALGADGGLAFQSQIGPVQYFPRSFSSWTNIVGVAGLRWTDTSYIFAIRSDGAVLTDEYHAYFRPPSTFSNVVAIALGASHALALRSDGTLTAWGNNINGVLNIPPGTTNVAAIVSGPYHSLALLRNGKVIAWGSNVYGQTNVPTELSNVVAISTSQQHSLALKSDGTIVGWGNTTSGSFHGPMNSISNVAAIASGWGDIAILTNGSLISFLPGYGTGYPKFLPVPGMVTNVVTAFADLSNIAISGQGCLVHPHCLANWQFPSDCRWYCRPHPPVLER
jgi:Alpha-tubulin suppressor and related RCC1 domain-containing proteins